LLAQLLHRGWAGPHLRHQPLQLRVLLLQLLQPTRLVYLQTAVLLTPTVVRLLHDLSFFSTPAPSSSRRLPRPQRAAANSQSAPQYASSLVPSNSSFCSSLSHLNWYKKRRALQPLSGRGSCFETRRNRTEYADLPNRNIRQRLSHCCTHKECRRRLRASAAPNDQICSGYCLPTGLNRLKFSDANPGITTAAFSCADQRQIRPLAGHPARPAMQIVTLPGVPSSILLEPLCLAPQRAQRKLPH
jgi:hypothetical protein